jgi:hypothetical protein
MMLLDTCAVLLTSWGELARIAGLGKQKEEKK